MPTIPRRPAAQRERERLQARQLRAAELFATGVAQAEIARQLGVSAQAVSVWYRCWEAGGAAPRPGPLTFACEWPAQQVPQSRAEIDAGLVLEAAGHAVAIWPAG